MARTKVLDRSSIEILLHDRRSDVRGAADRRRVPELLRDEAHDCGDLALLRRRRLREPGVRRTLGEVNRRKQRPAPRPKVLRGELLAEIELDVVVEPFAREVV